MARDRRTAPRLPSLWRYAAGRNATVINLDVGHRETDADGALQDDARKDQIGLKMRPVIHQAGCAPTHEAGGKSLDLRATVDQLNHDARPPGREGREPRRR